MEMNQYQNLAWRTANIEEKETQFGFLPLSVLALGVAGEAGEVADIVKKVVGHGHQIEIDKIKKELGDVLWYVATIAKYLELDLSDVAEANIDKLKKRYPEGFSSERSINRVEEVHG